MTLEMLQVGMEWLSEHPGGLNRVYAHLLREFASQDMELLGLVAGSPNVTRVSNGLANAFAPLDASLAARMRALRGAAVPWLRVHPDALIVSHFALHALPLLDQVRRHPFVVHFQGPWGEESRAEGASGISAAIKSFVERRVYRRADRAIVLSRAFGDILHARFGVPRDRIHVVPGGVEVARFAHEMPRDDCRRALGWPTDRPIILCVRRLVHRVGLDLLIAAAEGIRRRVPDALILIAGTGPLAKELQHLITAGALHDTVRLVGFVSEESLPLAYRAANMTVVPSLALEGFGLIVVESLAAGTPCIVTPVGGLPDIVAPLSSRLVATSTAPADIATALVGALLNETDLPSPSECTEFARMNFDWPVIARGVRAVYEQALR